MASNGYGEHSPGGYSFGSALVSQVVMTFMFLVVILGVTDRLLLRGLGRGPSVSRSRRST